MWASILILFLSATMTVTWTLPCLLLLFTPYTLHKVTNREIVSKLRKVFRGNAAVTIDGERAAGFVVGKGYFGYIKEAGATDKSGGVHMYLLASPTRYAELKDQAPTEVASSSDDPGHTVWERSGNFFDLAYPSRGLNLKFKPQAVQQDVITQVANRLAWNDHVTVYLHGLPGTGKTMVARLLAQQLGGHYCDTWSPTDPGDELSVLYNSVGPTAAKPLVLVLDEFDQMLVRVHKGTVPHHKYIPVPVRDKTTWNQLLDRQGLGVWPHLAIFLVSNQGPAWVKEMDPSYVRPGRVDLFVGMDDPLVPRDDVAVTFTA